MNSFKTLLAGAVLAVTASAGNAAVYYANDVVATYGSCTGSVEACGADDRTNVENAKGAADGKFYSLGLGGSAIFGFAMDLFPAGTISAFEITFNRFSEHNEAAAVYTLDNAFNIVQSLGTIVNKPTGNGSVYASQAFTYIKLVDVTLDYFDMTESFDGYDVDSVGVAPVPLPAAGVLLLAGLGGFAALRRRKTAA